MKKPLILAAAAAIALGAPMSASAQFGGLRSMMPSLPGVPGLPAASGNAGATGGGYVDPDRFLADTIETTKFVMIAAAILQDAASAAPNEVALQDKLRSINDVQDIKELDAHRAQMDQDLAGINENQNLSAQVQANLQRASAKQRERVARALVNFAIGGYFNAKLFAEAPQVMKTVQTNPRLIMRMGQFMLAVRLLGDEVKASAGALGSIHTIMTAARVTVPAPSETSRPTAISLN